MNKTLNNVVKVTSVDYAKFENISVKSIANVFRMLGTLGAKDRFELAESVIGYLKFYNITLNNKRKVIVLERVRQQISAMLRNIRDKRVGWWSTYNVIENEKELKLIVK